MPPSTHVTVTRHATNNRALPPHTTQVCDFWDSNLKQYTFHSGGPWKEWEHQNGSQFYGLSRRLEGTVPIYDFWNRKIKKLTFHAEPEGAHEEKKGLQFYAFVDQVARSICRPRATPESA